MKIFFKTFGCRVNQYETEALRERFLADGCSGDTDDYEAADLCVINTCAVTGEADKDSLQMVRRIARRNPRARLVVTGCCAARDAARIRAAAPEAIICGNEGKDDIPRLLGFSCGPGGKPIRRFAGHSRAFIKVQDGCDMACTYCVVPAARPTLSCRPWEEVRDEAAGLLETGYRELVLCGIRMGRYLSEDSGRRVDLVGLIQRLLDLPGDFRLRLSSLEITDVTPRLLGLFQAGGGHGAAAPGAAPSSSRGGGGRLAPSLHLPLQSGSSSVLQRMGRWYTAELAARRLEELRSACPGAAVFTDVMTGFPGETEAEAEESFRFVRDAGFSGLHVFRYSRREGTPAAGFPGPLPPGLILERAERMRALDAELRREFAAGAVGSRRRVVVEEEAGGGPRTEALTDHFLRVVLDRNPGPGLHWVRIERSEGPLAFGSVEG